MAQTSKMQTYQDTINALINESVVLSAARASPAVVDGMVYMGSFDNKTYCLDASTGALVWNYQTGYWIDSSPAVADGESLHRRARSKTEIFNLHSNRR